MVFPVVKYGCETWTIKKAECWTIAAFELWCWRRLLRVCKEIQPVHPKGNQSWIFTGRTDVEAEAPILWSPDEKIWLLRKYPDAEKDWGQKETGTTEDEMVGWHHQLNRHEFEHASWVGDSTKSFYFPFSPQETFCFFITKRTWCILFPLTSSKQANSIFD